MLSETPAAAAEVLVRADGTWAVSQTEEPMCEDDCLSEAEDSVPLIDLDSDSDVVAPPPPLHEVLVLDSDDEEWHTAATTLPTTPPM